MTLSGAFALKGRKEEEVERIFFFSFAKE